MIALLLMLLGADPVIVKEMRVLRYETRDGGYHYGAMVSGVTADGGVLDSEACLLKPIDYAVLRRITETSAKACLAERAEP